MAEGVRHVLLDADGVLQSHPGGFVAAAAAFVEDPAEFFAEVSALELGYLRGRAGFLDGIAAALEGRGVGAGAEEVHTAVWRDVRIDPGVEGLVVELRDRGLGVHLASNQEPVRASYLKTRYDGLLDRCYYSCDLGAAKPDAAFFEAVLADLRVSGQEVLFIDDNQANVAGARAVGLRAEHWDNTRDLTLLRELLSRHGCL